MLTPSGATLRRVVRARDLLHARLHEGPTLDELASEAGLSRAFLARSFAAAFGTPPHQYLRTLRINHAKALLARGASVTEACMAVGFSSLGTFSTTFQRKVGVAPREWQKSARTVVLTRGLPALYIPGCYAAFFVGHV